MKYKSTLLVMLLAVLAATAALAEGRWTFQVGTGTGYSFPMPISIKQDGEKDINLTGRFVTKPFSTLAYYYNFKIGYWENGAAWEFESLHHKVYLDNKPDEVQKFAISHGYNMNMVNRAWEIGWLIYRVGGGFVMTHPETEVRGRKWEDDGGINGFYISGLCIQGAVEKRYWLNDDWFLSAEAKLTMAHAVIPIAGGEASVPNIALHGIGSLGYAF